MKPKNLSRTSRLLVGTVTMLAMAAPAYAMSPTPASDDANAELPARLQAFKTPFKKAKNQRVIRRAAKKYGPGKKALPRFKKKASDEKKLAAIAALNRTMADMKRDEKTPQSIRDGIRVWESMTPAQRDDLLTETEAVVAAWPAGVAATAAVVAATAAVTELTYKVYKDYRDGGDDDDGDKEPDDDGGGGGDGDGGGDGGACPSCHEVIQDALSY